MRRLFSVVGILFLLAQLLVPPGVAMANPDLQYRLISWKFGVTGDSGGVTFGYIAKDGSRGNAGLPLEKSMYAGHENDPSWTGYDSVAPILAYIKKYGIDNNIKDTINTPYYDPTILKSLAAQGVTLQQLGGPSNPQAWEASAYNDNVNKVLTGVGIPTPDLSGLIGSSSASTPKNTPPTTSTSTASPTPPAQVKPPTTTQSTTRQTAPSPTVKTEPPSTQKVPKTQQVNPDRLNPPAWASMDTTTTKIPEPTPKTAQAVTKPSPWIKYGIAGGIVLLAGIAVFVIKRYKFS